MKVHAFKVRHAENSLDTSDVFKAIRKIVNDAPAKTMTIGGCDVRVEEIEFQNGCWLANFVKERVGHGPTKYSKTKPSAGFEFDEDDGFGEESSCLYDPDTQHMIVQYNHIGVRSSHIEHFLNNFLRDSHCQVELVPKIDKETDSKLKKKKLLKKLSFSLDLNKITELDKQAGAALSEAIGFGREAGGDVIRIEISAKRTGKPLTEQVKTWIDHLKSSTTGDEGPVKKLEVSGKDTIDSRTEVLDLLGGRLVHEFTDIKTGRDHRFPVDEIWIRLFRAKAHWKAYLR